MTRRAPLPSVDDAVAAIDRAQAPAIVGLGGLTIEGLREAVRLGERMRGRLLPWPLGSSGAGVGPVQQTATLGHMMASDLVIWVGGHADRDAVTRRIAEHQLRAAFAPSDLDTVLRLRDVLRRDPAAEPMGGHKRIAVALAPGVDARVAAQWHMLAADVQTTTRVSVVTLPDLAHHGNQRGAIEVVAWQTGLSIESGGIEFPDGGPRRCPDYASLMLRGAIDLVIDASWSGLPERAPLGLPRFAPKLAAQVMRFDGVLLWLCDDPRSAPPDPVAMWLAQVADRIGGRP